MSDFPQWATNCIDKWQLQLFLHEWKIKTKLVDRPDDDSGALACVTIYVDVMQAHLDIRDDIPTEYDEDWERTIIHELLHVRLGRLTDLVQRDFIPEFAPPAQALAEKSLRREVESAVELLAAVLFYLDGLKG